MRTLKFLTVSYFAAALVFTLFAVAHFPIEKLANLIFDDAYYYLGVAQNIAEGRGSSFGNLVETNGYQPLWLLILAGVIYALSLPKVWAFAAVPVLIGLIKIIAVLRIDTAKGLPAIALFIATVLIILLCPNIFSHGLETSLLLLCLPLLSQLRDYPEAFAPKTAARYGAIFLILFLIRLDALAIAGAFTLFALASRKKHSISNLSVTWAIIGAGVLVYFAVNFALFGTIVPVSGQAKAIGNRVGENLPILWKYLIASRIAIGAFVLSLLVRAGLKNGWSLSLPFSHELRLITVAAVAIAGYYAVFSGWPIWGWYYWPVALVTFYALAQLAYLGLLLYKQIGEGWRPRLLMALAWGFIAYVLLLGVRTEMAHDTNVFYSALRKDAKPDFTVMNIRLVNDFFAKQPDGVVAMGDRAGGLGFWLPERFRFFHTEGLVGNKEYIRARKEGRGLEFLKDLGIKYFVVERERLIEEKQGDGTVVHGIVEPVQALSTHSGLILICLPESAILYRQNYEKQIRYVYDFTRIIECPEGIRSKVDELSRGYGTLRKYSLPYEYEEDWTLMRYIKSNPF